MKYKYLTPDQKDRLSSYLVGMLKWNELTFCICDVKYFYGLKTVLKVLEIDVCVDDINSIQRFLESEKSIVSAKEGDVVISWI